MSLKKKNKVNPRDNTLKNYNSDGSLITYQLDICKKFYLLRLTTQ